jgi:hypothetical protein
MIEKTNGLPSYRDKMERLSLTPRGLCKMGIDAIRVQRRIAWDILKNNSKEDIEPVHYQQIQSHLEQMEIRELLVNTETQIKEVRASNLSDKEKIKMKQTILDEHSIKYKAILYKDAISPLNSLDLLLSNDSILHRGNSENNSETTVRIEPINREDNESIEDKIQREYNEKTEQEQHKTLWSDGVHIPGIHPPREKLKPRVYFANESFVTNQNLSVILASPGTGKSSICESILASVLNKDCDTLSFKVDEAVQRAIYFDTERDLSMIDRSNDRMLQRANVSEHLENALVVGLRENFSVKDKKEKIIQVIEHYQPQLILIDGVSDLMSNTNSEEETNLIIEWLNKIITHYNLSLITTLHPNKGTDTARGWIGSEMLRKCEGVILVKENVDEIRTMSVTKARDSAKPKASFKWCNDNLRMMSCEHNAKVGAIKKLNVIDALTNNELEQLKKSIGFEDMKYNEIATALQQYLKEEHPGVATGNNAIGVFLKDLGVNEVHLFKQGKAPKTTYKLRLVGAI